MHDVVPLSDPPFKARYARATKRALMTLTRPGYYPVSVSEFTRREMIRYGEMSGKEIPVIHEAASDVFWNGGNNRMRTVTNTVPDRYLLYVGGAGRNKNLDRMINAVSMIHGSLRLRLVLVGDPRWQYADLMRRVHENSDWIDFLGHVDDARCAGLYRNAAAVVMPSLHEGFGLPVVEAMASGTCVVCSDIPVFREVCGEAACYFNPSSVEDIARSINRVISDRGYRLRLKSLVKRRAAAYKWDRVARQTADVYRAAIADWSGRRTSGLAAALPMPA